MRNIITKIFPLWIEHEPILAGWDIIHVIVNWCTLPVKSLDTPTHTRVFLYLSYFLHCIIIVKSSKLWNNTWNNVVTPPKKLNKSKYILNLRFFKVATLFLDDSFAHSWHSLNHLHEVTWNAFQLTGMPC